MVFGGDGTRSRGQNSHALMRETPLETPANQDCWKGPKARKDSRAIRGLMVTTILNLLINGANLESTGSKNMAWWAMAGPMSPTRRA